jgi:hypothetical protein
MAIRKVRSPKASFVGEKPVSSKSPPSAGHTICRHPLVVAVIVFAVIVVADVVVADVCVCLLRKPVSGRQTCGELYMWLIARIHYTNIIKHRSTLLEIGSNDHKFRWLLLGAQMYISIETF